MFGDGLYLSLGTMELRISTLDGDFISFKSDVVDADIPLLLGIEVPYAEGMVADNVDNVLEHRTNN